MTWAVVTFIAAAAFFTVGAACNGIGASWRTAREIVEAAVVVVFIVGVASGGRGCSVGSHGFDDALAVPAAAVRPA